MKNSSSIYISFGDLEHIYLFQNFVLDDVHDHSVTLLEIGVMSYWFHFHTLHKLPTSLQLLMFKCKLGKSDCTTISIQLVKMISLIHMIS